MIDTFENDSDHDPDYLIETESSDDDCSSLDNSDEELNECRQSRKLFKEQLASEKFRDVSSHESSFESDELRSVHYLHCVCGATGHRKNKCPTPQEEFSKGKEKSKETTTTETTTETDKPKRTYKPKRKACIPWRTKNTASQAFELKRAPSQRKKLEIRRKPALSIREEDEEYLDQDF
ncbi:hypothetical protein POM88_046816 [Heracleum sosnowskyi]|uniref:Uncharacterized protein n=1 Tax=Heracleum sosnowskyi TaxID=360622 RepID=A0AAD8M7G4_9APIA|nr:hypothetical protein POM88_046816 [Heracleum sosnowskyi]